MDDALELWEFTDHHPSGHEYLYQLEQRFDGLRLHSDDPHYREREAAYSRDLVLIFLKYLLETDGNPVQRTEIRHALWPEADDPDIVDTYLRTLRKLLDDDAHANRRAGVLGGRIIQTFKNKAIRFVPDVRYIPAWIQKQGRLSAFASVPSKDQLITRAELIEPLIHMLTTPSDHSEITVIEGMSGIGKTMLATELCHDQRVRDVFPDGIVWLTIGQEPTQNFDQRVEFICTCLNQRFDKYPRASYQTALADKAVLIVLDDVWDLADVDQFRLDSPVTRLLVTSRDKNIGNCLRTTRRKELLELKPTESRRFLAHWSGRPIDDLPEPHASEIVRECAGLPLGIAMVGASLCGESDDEWAHAVNKLNNARLTLIGERLTGYAFTTLYAAIAVSVEALEKIRPDLKLKQKYLQLAVLIDGMSAPPQVLETLWGVADDDRREAIAILARRSLIRRESAAIRLHALQHDYLRCEFRDSEALALIHSAVKRSLHVITHHASQFASQTIARLLPHLDHPSVARYVELLDSNEPRPRLRSIWPTFDGGSGLLHRILVRTEPILHCRICGDGTVAAAGTAEGLMVWDLKGPLQPRTFADYREPGQSFAISFDGRHVAYRTGRESSAVVIRRLDEDAPVTVVDPLLGSVLAISDDGLIVTTRLEDTIFAWHVNGRCEGSVSNVPNGFAISPEGRWVLSCPHLILKSLTDDITIVLDGPVAENSRFAMSRDAECIVECHLEEPSRKDDSSPQTPPEPHKLHITRWAREEGYAARTRIFDWDFAFPSAVAVNSDGAVVIASWGALHYFAANGTHRVQSAPGTTQVEMTADGRKAVTLSGSSDKTVALWDLTRGVESPATNSEPSVVLSLSVSRDRETIASISCNDHTVWSLPDGRKLKSFDISRHHIASAAISADRQRSVAWLWGERLVVWEGDDFSQPHTVAMLGEPNLAFPVVLSADGRWCLSRTSSKTATLWDLEGEVAARSITGIFGRAAALSQDGTWALLGAPGLTIRGLGPDVEDQVLDAETHPSAVAISADGKVGFCVADYYQPGVPPNTKCKPSVWDLEARRLVHRLPEYGSSSAAVAVSEDGKRLAAAFDDGVVIVWRSQTGEEVSRVTCDQRLTCCTWANHYLVVGDSTGRVHVFECEDETPSG